MNLPTVEKVDDENFRLTGNLTLKNISLPVILNVEFGGITKDPWGNERAGFTVNGKIKRSDWGIKFGLMEAGGAMLGDEVKIHSEVQLVKQTEAVAVSWKRERRLIIPGHLFFTVRKNERRLYRNRAAWQKRTHLIH